MAARPSGLRRALHAVVRDADIPGGNSRSVQLTSLSVPGCLPWREVLWSRRANHDGHSGDNLWRTGHRHFAAPAMGIDSGATLLRTGRYRSRNFLRDQFQCAIAGRPREDHSHRRTDRVFDPALSVDSQPAAPRPYVTLTCLRGFGKTGWWRGADLNRRDPSFRTCSRVLTRIS